MHVKVASRKSDLARIQAYAVGAALEAKGASVSYHFSESLGDKNLTDPLWKMPAKGVFTEDFYLDLIDGKVDLVVHSWKDLPTEVKPLTTIAATLERADVRDLLLFKKDSIYKKQIKIFSSSPRRTENLSSFLAEALPIDPKDTKQSALQVEFLPVRGNINTRVRKLLQDSEVDGLVLAKAAWDRLMSASQNAEFGAYAKEFLEVRTQLQEALNVCNWMVLPLSVNPTAAAQGALAIEVLKSRHDLRKLLTSINDEVCFSDVQFERETLASFGGGCHSALGISRLNRPYGNVTFIKGKSPQGSVVHVSRIDSATQMPSFAPDELWSSRDLKFDRQEIKSAQSTSGKGHQLVTRAPAYVPGQVTDGVVWTSGTATWKALSHQGVWVNGTLDGLGDQEDPNILNLLTEAQQTLPWFRMTSQFSGHDALSRVKFNNIKEEILETYKLDYDRKSLDFTGKKCFFWTSGRIFVDALTAHPELANAYHCCGPGRTYQYIKDYIPAQQIGLFLNEEDWRAQCLATT